MPKYLTTKEVADTLRTSPETLRFWAWRGEGPDSFKSGRKRLYAVEDVEAWIKEQRRLAKKPPPA